MSQRTGWLGSSLAFRSRIRGITTALALTVSLQGCHKWVAQSAPAPEVWAAHHESTVRLTLSDGRRTLLFDPRVTGDSIVGSTNTHPASGMLRFIPLSDIRSIEVQRFDGDRTTLLVVGFVAALAILFQIIDSAIEDSITLGDFGECALYSCGALRGSSP